MIEAPAPLYRHLSDATPQTAQLYLAANADVYREENGSMRLIIPYRAPNMLVLEVAEPASLSLHSKSELVMLVTVRRDSSSHVQHHYGVVGSAITPLSTKITNPDMTLYIENGRLVNVHISLFLLRTLPEAGVRIYCISANKTCTCSDIAGVVNARDFAQPVSIVPRALDYPKAVVRLRLRFIETTLDCVLVPPLAHDTGGWIGQSSGVLAFGDAAPFAVVVHDQRTAAFSTVLFHDGSTSLSRMTAHMLDSDPEEGELLPSDPSLVAKQFVPQTGIVSGDLDTHFEKVRHRDALRWLDRAIVPARLNLRFSLLHPDAEVMKAHASVELSGFDSFGLLKGVDLQSVFVTLLPELQRGAEIFRMEPLNIRLAMHYPNDVEVYGFPCVPGTEDEPLQLLY